jgi:lipopolysaccharide/colanic/teichoic acid biosynthesis glycosyltransferase
LATDGSSALIKQTRVGLHGREFSMYKLRTMRKDSHSDRENLEEFNESGGPLFKMKNDPRLIKGAKFLRKYSIDELPQFINILNGSMSLVGPRPLFPEDNKYFDEHYIRRLNVLPGLTGLLQINERNTSDFNIWYKYDIEYIDNWSIFLDIKIIFLTPFSLFRTKTKGK